MDIPKDTKNGDYATSFALAAAKALGKAPRDIAQALMDHMELEGSYFDKVEMAGPGFPASSKVVRVPPRPEASPSR